jgi:hypothetical protein
MKAKNLHLLLKTLWVNLKTDKYFRMKLISVFLTGIGASLSIWGGIALSEGKYLLGSLLIATYISILLVDTFIVFWIWERLTGNG